MDLIDCLHIFLSQAMQVISFCLTETLTCCLGVDAYPWANKYLPDGLVTWHMTITHLLIIEQGPQQLPIEGTEEIAGHYKQV